MVMEESHPLTIVPDLFDQLTPFERKQVLARWNLRYDAANRLVHPVTKLGSPESIARAVILDSISRKYLGVLYLATFAAASLLVSGDVGGIGGVVLGVIGVVGAVAAVRWGQRRRLVTGYFSTHFPTGPTRLPQRRRGDDQ